MRESVVHLRSVFIKMRLSVLDNNSMYSFKVCVLGLYIDNVI